MQDFTSSDLGQLKAHGISAAEAGRQLAQLRQGQCWTRLVRPCTVGDGIHLIPLSRQTALLERFAAAAGEGRITRFVPASGAATRMFQPLQAQGDEGDELRRFLGELDRFPFVQELAGVLACKGDTLEALRRAGDLPRLLEMLLEPDGLDYARQPKGLLPFHRVDGETRTAFVEHLAETALLVGTGNLARMHCTVSPEHRAPFNEHLSAWRERLERAYEVLLDVTFSEQQPATDTLALAADGHPLRDADGRLALRPGGHGALLANLAALPGEVILIRNIDNVVTDARKADNLLWDRLLGGLLLELVDRQRMLVNRLRHTPGDREVCRQATDFLRKVLGVALPEKEPAAEQLGSLLDRPLRVCGVVRNSGEPGGGPFWVRSADGALSRQIVESSQVDRSDREQRVILSAATHFNPVDIACVLRDGNGQPYDLERFVDHAAAIVTGKVQNGQPVRILERPGLWNGGMAGWLTLFVELPPGTFNPVKTVFDLLRPAHQP